MYFSVLKFIFNLQAADSSIIINELKTKTPNNFQLSPALLIGATSQAYTLFDVVVVLKWAHSKKGTFQKGHKSKKEHVPNRAHLSTLKKGTFQKEHIPNRAHLSTFQKGHIPKWEHSKKSTFQIRHILFSELEQIWSKF